MGTEKTAGKGSVPSQEADRLKELGFVQNRGTDKFNCRVVTRSGRMDVPELKEITYMAEQYGESEVILTGDGTIEIKGISYGNVNKVLEHCRKHQISTGGTGARVRPIVTCTGRECAYSIFDSYALAEKLRELFYVRLHNVKLPNKLEIAVSGCPNNCVDADLFDIGIIGVKIPQCEMVSICSLGTITKGMMAYRVYAGGNKGQEKKEGYSFDRLFTTEESVLSIVDRLIGLYQEEGIEGEAFYETMERVGFGNVEQRVLINQKKG